MKTGKEVLYSFLGALIGIVGYNYIAPKIEIKAPLEQQRGLSVDRIELVNKKGEVQIAIEAEPNPILAVRNNKGKMINLPLDKAAERLQSFMDVQDNENKNK